MFITKQYPSHKKGYQKSKDVTELKCVFCKKSLPLNEFSDVNQQKAGVHKPNETKYKQKNYPIISCKKCTSHPDEKLRCYGCGFKKPLEEFSKVQRKNTGMSYCAKCIRGERSEIGWTSDSE